VACESLPFIFNCKNQNATLHNMNLPPFSGHRDKTTFESHAACFNCA